MPDPTPTLTDEQRDALWEAIERAFLDTTTYSRELEDEVERVIARMVAEAEQRALRTPVSLLEMVLHLRMNGENAPGGDETWRKADVLVETYLRSLRARADEVTP